MPAPLAGGAFTDWVSFSTTSPVLVDASISGSSSTAISFALFDIYDNSFSLLYTGTSFNIGPKIASGGVSEELSGTSYYLKVVGTAAAGSTYNGNISLSPVPEIDSYAMLIAGLGLFVFAARRRKQ